MKKAVLRVGDNGEGGRHDLRRGRDPGVGDRFGRMAVGEPPRDRVRSASEVIILAIAGLSPWAIGAVDAWAQLVLDVALVALAILMVLTARVPGRAPQFFGVPGLALAGLALLAIAQAAPLPPGVLRWIAPATESWRAGLAPAVAQRVVGGASRPVAPPAATISHDPEASLRTAGQLAGAWILFQAVLATAPGYGPLRRFSLFTVANACALTLFSFVQALAWNGKIYGIRSIPTPAESGWFVGGPFVSKNHLAAYLNVAFGMALGLLLATIQRPAQRQRGRSGGPLLQSAALWAGAAAGLIFAGIVASHSRGGFLAALISTTITLVLLRPRSLRLGPTLGVTAAVTALFLIFIGTTSPFERLATIKDSASVDGLGGRFEVWGIVLRTWRAFPVWGTGLGTFPAATAPFYLQKFGNRYFSHAESEYFQMLTEGGVIGLGLALLALASIARLAWRARAAASGPREHALILGAMAGGLALLIQCLSDFPLHIPGVAITALALAGHLCRLGREAAYPEPIAVPSTTARVGPLIGGLAAVALSLVLVVQGVRFARAEALVRGVGLPFPGTLMPTVDPARQDDEELKRTRDALEAALRLRPDWAEGHLRLGAVLMGLYANLAERWLEQFQEEKSPEAAAILCDPLWLHGVVHSAAAQDLAALGGVVDQEPVRTFLIPAARCFLEARRCSPDLGLSHARLAELDYLIDRGETTAVHASRALRLTGYDHLVLVLAGQAAAQAGDLDLAARCWRKALAVQPDWNDIVVAAALAMTPDQILEKVLPPGARYPLFVADRIYSGPEWREAREKFLRAALERLPDDHGLAPHERLWLEGQARARLGERQRARKLMEEALLAEPSRPDWWEELIDFLVAWGEIDEASRQARIGLTLHPDHPGIRRASESVLNASAQGEARPSPAN